MTFALPTSFRQTPLYLEWVRRHHPDDAVRAAEVLETIYDQLVADQQRPREFMFSMDYQARKLPAEHLPWFWDTVAQKAALFGSDKTTRIAATAYSRARAAEAEHDLPVDTDHHIANACFMAGLGALPAKEVRGLQRLLLQDLPPERAHTEFVSFLAARARGGAAPAASTHSMLGKTAKAAALDGAEHARALGEVLAASRGSEIPQALLKGAAKVFTKNPPPSDQLTGLVELFPPRTPDHNGALWLDMLDAAGAIEAMVRGLLVPEEGVTGWLEHFVRCHRYETRGQGVGEARMAPALYELLPRLAPRLRAENRPLRTWESLYSYVSLDGDLIGACLAHDIPVELPPRGWDFSFWGGEHVGALLAHPVLGPRLEAQVSRFHRDPHNTVRGRGRSAIALVPDNADMVALVRERVRRLMRDVAGAGMLRAADSLRTLDDLLDPAAVRALEGVEDELGALDPSGPLLRALREGLPEELGWPAFDEAVAELGGEDAVTALASSWPVLTLLGPSKAIAVGHEGRLGECTPNLPEDARSPNARYVDGRFLVSWSAPREQGRTGRSAYWSDRPDQVLTTDWEEDWETASQANPDNHWGFWSGYRFTPPALRLRHSEQMSDGAAVWTYADSERSRRWSGHTDEAWRGLTAGTVDEEPSLPGFFTAGPGEGMRWDDERLSLAPLPPDVDSPLGSSGGLSGFRVAERTDRPGPYSDDYVIEGADGRRAHHHRPRAMGYPWGILRFPGTDAEMVVTGGRDNTSHEQICCYSASDDTCAWEVLIAPVPAREWSKEKLPFFPPFGFWHFLTLRAPASAKALRGIEPAQARALLDAHLAGGPEQVRATLAELLPDVTHERTQEGVLRSVAAAAELRRARARTVERVTRERVRAEQEEEQVERGDQDG